MVIANDSLKYRKEILEKNGYVRQQEEDYDNYVYPDKIDVSIVLPNGYKLVYGNEYTNEENKWSSCNLGFHPNLEDTNYRNNMGAYNSRKKSSMYKDSFECLIIDEVYKTYHRCRILHFITIIQHCLLYFYLLQ